MLVTSFCLAPIFKRCLRLFSEFFRVHCVCPRMIMELLENWQLRSYSLEYVGLFGQRAMVLSLIIREILLLGWRLRHA